MKDNQIQMLALSFLEDGNEDTFKSLLERINWGMRGYVFKIVRNNDAVNEVCLKTYEDLYYKTKTHFDPTVAKFSTWAYTIAKNNALKHVNKECVENSTMCSIDVDGMYETVMDMDYDINQDNVYCIDEGINYVYENGNTTQIDKHNVVDLLYDASIKCINELPDNIRVVMYDRLVNNKKIENVAIDNNLPYSSVVNWIRSGRLAIEKKLKSEYSHLCELYLYY